MNITVAGAGRIGGNIARRLAEAGHQVTITLGTDPATLESRAAELGVTAVGDPKAAVAGAGVVVVAVPWSVLPEALERLGSLEDRIVIDTTNQFGTGPKPAEGQTAAAFNADRMPGARYTKCFNTLTAAFQAETARREPRVVQWICGDDPGARDVVSGLVRDAGYEPVDLGGTATCAVMEAPRRAGAVYGEEYRLPDARAVVEALAAGRRIPPAPEYPA